MDRHFLKARILLQNHFYTESLEEVENLMRKNIKPDNEGLFNPKWLDFNQDATNQMLIKQWETIKQGMNQWDDLIAVSKGTEKQFINKINLFKKSA